MSSVGGIYAHIFMNVVTLNFSAFFYQQYYENRTLFQIYKLLMQQESHYMDLPAESCL